MFSQIGVKYGGEDIPGSPFEMTSNADTSDVIGDGSSRKNSGRALHTFNLHLGLLKQFITKSHPSDNCLWLFFTLETKDGITFSAIIFKLPCLTTGKVSICP